MAYKSPDYTKTSDVEGIGMEFYAPDMSVCIVAIAIIALAGTPCHG